MATTAADPVFVDTNVLVYSTIPASPFHAQAVKALTDTYAPAVSFHVIYTHPLKDNDNRPTVCLRQGGTNCRLP
jgi:hypothetical protein